MRLAVALAIASVAVSLILIARAAEPMFPLSDEALMEMATREAASGQQRLGAYSRFGWNHPGPLLFFLLAPFYLASGHSTAGLNAGAFAINLAALALVFYPLVRRGGPALTAAFAAVLWIYLTSLEPLLVSSWNAHVDLLACVATLVCAAAVSAGSVKLTPLLAFGIAFIVQSHVAVLPLAVAAALVPLGRRLGDRTFWEPAFWAVVVFGVLWLPPVLDAWSERGGNAARLWAFFQNPGMDRAPAGEAYTAWARMLTAVFRGQLTLPGLAAPPDSARWPLVAAPLLLVLLTAAAWWARQRRRQMLLWLAVSGGAAAMAALAAIMLKPGEILAHEVFWVTTIGVVCTGTLLGSGLAVAGERLRFGIMAGQLLASAAVILVMATAAIDGFNQLRAVVSRSHVLNDYDRTVRDATNAVDSALNARGARRTIVTVDNRVWDTAAAIILQLQKRGVDVVMEDATLRSRYAGTNQPDGTEAAILHFCGGPCHEQQRATPGNAVVYVSGVIAVDLQARKSG